MIGDIDIRVNASSPHLPIGPVCAVEGSAQRIRVMGAPTRQEDWRLMSVAVEVTYPDGVLQSVQCERDGYAWTATVPASTTPGRVERGVTISAMDEQGSRYVLGTGDLYIISHGAVPSPDMRTWAVRLCDAKPDTPKDGDMWLDGDNTLYLYHDGEAHTAMDMTPYATHADLKDTATDLCAYTVSLADKAKHNGIYLVSEPWRIRGDRVYQRLVPAQYDYGQWRVYHMDAGQWVDAVSSEIVDIGGAYVWQMDMGGWGARLQSNEQWTYTPEAPESKQYAYQEAAQQTTVTTHAIDGYWQQATANRTATEVPEHWDDVDRLALSSEVSSQISSMAADVSQSCREYTDQAIAGVEGTVGSLSTQMSSYGAAISSLSSQVSTDVQYGLPLLSHLKPGRMYVVAPTTTETGSRSVVVMPPYRDEHVYQCQMWLDYTHGREPYHILSSSNCHVYRTGLRYPLSALPADQRYHVDVMWWTLSGETTVLYRTQTATQG